jgi:hypothetical protein
MEVDEFKEKYLADYEEIVDRLNEINRQAVANAAEKEIKAGKGSDESS